MARNRLSETPTQATLSMPEIRFYSGSTYEPYKWQSNNRDLQVVQLLEQRNKEAADAQAKYNTQLSQLKNVLNPAESEWIKEKEQEIDDTISAYILSNDYAGLRNYVTQAPSQLLKSNEYLNRVKAQEKYLEAQKIAQDKLNNGEIDNITYQRWNEENQYSYQDEFDAAGNVTLSAPWTSNWTPVTKANWSSIVERAFKQVTPYINTSNTQVGGYTQGNKNVTINGQKAPQAPDNTTWGYTNNVTTQSVALEDIVENLQYLMDTDEYKAINQDYLDRVYEYRKLNNAINNPSISDSERNEITERLSYLKTLLGPYGSSFKDYCKKQIEQNAIAQNLAYKNRAVTTNSDINPLSTSGAGSGSGGQNNSNRGETPGYNTGSAGGGNQKGGNSGSVIDNIASMWNNY